jgi:hypothetical protein
VTVGVESMIHECARRCSAGEVDGVTDLARGPRQNASMDLADGYEWYKHFGASELKHLLLSREPALPQESESDPQDWRSRVESCGRGTGDPPQLPTSPGLVLSMAVIMPPFHPFKVPSGLLAANWEIVNIPYSA